MLFITNRLPCGSIQSEAGRRFEFDLANNAPSHSIFFCEETNEGEFLEVGGLPFLSRLKDLPQKQLLLTIHGFSTLPAAALAAARELQSLCDAAEEEEVLVVPLIWPCDSDFGIVKDYWDDQKSADASGIAFSRALCRFLEWRDSPLNEPASAPCLKRINLLAHSMGNRVLRETLVHWNRYDLPEGVPLIFRNVFLVAADIENESLQRGERGELITDSARNVVVYYAADDLALRSSKMANLRNRIASRRLGHSGPENMERVAANVYAVDCDDVNTLYDHPRGHTYFRSQPGGGAGRVFEHIFTCLQTGRVPGEGRKSRILA